MGSLPVNEIIQGDALSVLKTFPDESVHCVITSPPYWGLRKYPMEPVVWDGDPSCAHEWGEAIPFVRKGDPNRGLGGTGNGNPGTRLPGLQERSEQTTGDSGSWCQRCGAWKGHLGLEPTIGLYVQHITEIFREVRRVLRSDGTLWLNLGDCYATGAGSARSPGGKCFGKQDDLVEEGGYPKCQPNRMPQDSLKPKDLVGLPWRIAFALQEDGWYLRMDNIWAKPSCMPESVTDRPTRAHEFVFLLAKSERYFYDSWAIREPLAPGSLLRINQSTFDTQTGGPKDAINPNRSMRGALENLAAKMKRPSGWNEGPTEDDKIGRYRSGNKERKLDVPTRPNDHRGSSIPWEDTGMGRNKRSVWWIPTAPFSMEYCAACGRAYDRRPPGGKCACGRTDAWVGHFATFPPELAEICLLAGTSEKGCCSKCGKPWHRVLKERARPGAGLQEGVPANERDGGLTSEDGMERTGMSHFKYTKWLRENPSQTEGWKPGCSCNAEVIPCTVLDPFMGSGTTALVALKAGRRFVGIELSKDYVAMARKRIEPELIQSRLM